MHGTRNSAVMPIGGFAGTITMDYGLSYYRAGHLLRVS